MNIEYIVVCREDRKDDGTPGDYTLVTRTVFPNKEAAETFADGCASERQAIVVGGRFDGLRRDFEDRFGASKKTTYICGSKSTTVSEDTGVVTVQDSNNPQTTKHLSLS